VLEAAPESEDDSEKMLIDELEELSESSSESSEDFSFDPDMDFGEEAMTPEASTLKQKQELSLANGSFLGRAIFTPDSTLPIGMKRSSQVMLYAVPYDPAIHAAMPAATPMSVKWSENSFEASPPKKRRVSTPKVRKTYFFLAAVLILNDTKCI
jgi:hypothetical protein